jgi:hypothetical protein
MRRRAWWATLTAACVLAMLGVSAAPASAGGQLTVLRTAEPVLLPQYSAPPLIAGPRLMGDSVAWAGLTRRGYAVHVTDPDGRDRIAGEVRVPLPWPPPYRGYYGRLETSPSRLAFSLRVTPCWGAFVYECDFGGEVGEVLTAARDGSLEHLAGCGDRCEGCPYSDGVPVDVSGDDVLYGAPCHRGTAFARSFAPGAEPEPARLPKYSVRLAGDYVAVDDWRRPRVVSRSTGRTAYEVETDYYSGLLHDLQPDGKLAYGAPDDSECQVEQCPDQLPSWASPAEPGGHAVGADAIYRLEMRMAGDRIAYRPFARPPWPLGRIGVVDLAGNTVAAATVGSTIGEFDFNGSRLVYAIRPCASIAAVVWDLNGSPPRFPRGSCPVPRIAREPAHRHGTKVPVRLTCPRRGRLGCAGTVRVVADASGRRDGGADRTRGLGQAEYSVSPGATRTLAFAVDDAGMQFLARYRRVRIRVDAVSRERTDTGQPGLISHGSFRLLD